MKVTRARHLPQSSADSLYCPLRASSSYKQGHKVEFEGNPTTRHIPNHHLSSAHTQPFPNLGSEPMKSQHTGPEQGFKGLSPQDPVLRLLLEKHFQHELCSKLSARWAGFSWDAGTRHRDEDAWMSSRYAQGGRSLWSSLNTFRAFVPITPSAVSYSGTRTDKKSQNICNFTVVRKKKGRNSPL